MLNSKKSRHTASMLFAVPLIAVLSACGAPDTAEDESVPDSQGSQSETFDSFEEYQLALSECMRGKGIDMEDPDSGGQSITRADGAFMEAAEACQSEIGQPPAREGDGGDSAEALREEHLEIAECLREHGVDVPDPAPGEDLAIPSGVPNDAFETCAPDGVGGAVTGGD